VFHASVWELLLTGIFPLCFLVTLGNIRYLSFSLQLQYLSAELNTELNNKFEVQSGIY